MRIAKKTLFAGTVPAAVLFIFLVLSGSARAGVIVIGGKATSTGNMTVCDCTQAASGCGCIINDGGGGPAPNQN